MDNIEKLIDNLVCIGKITQSGLWQGDKTYNDYAMKVLRNQQLVIDIPKEIDSLISISKPDVEWAEEHFKERISGTPSNPGESYKRWPYATFDSEIDPYMEGLLFSHTYQERFWPKYAGGSLDNPKEEAEQGIRYELGDLNDVIKQLHNNPLTRQAYLPIFFPEDTGAKNNIRVPCSIGYYFWIEDDKLYCNYTIRSCDALRHFRNDVYLAGRLMQFVADRLNYKGDNINLEPSTLTMYIFNFHLFTNDSYALGKKENRLQKM